MTEELIIILSINIAFFVGYWTGRKQEKEKKEIEIIREIMKYDIPTLDYEKAEQFLNSDGCPDCLCEDCTKDCPIEKIRVKTCSTCKHFSKDVDAEEPCKSCYRQSYWEKEK